MTGIPSQRHASEVDVCVIGAGPAGLVVASELARAGRRIALLESGGIRDLPALQQLNDGDMIGEPYHGLIETRHRQVGGTTNLWNTPVDGAAGAKFLPLDPWDVAQWPIGWSDIEPFYVRAQQVCGLGPFRYDAGFWASGAAVPFTTDGTGLTTRVYQFGTAKFVNLMLQAVAHEPSATLVTEASVIGFELDSARRRVVAVRFARDGEVFKTMTGTVVLACGAIENARLLLAFPGAANTDWLGAGFMEHPRDYSLELVPRSSKLLSDARFYDLREVGEGHHVVGRLALTEEAIRTHGLVNASVTLLAGERERDKGRLSGRVVRLVNRLTSRKPIKGHGWSKVTSPDRVFDRFRLVLNLEQRPRRDNRVTLGSRVDQFGNRLPMLTLRWSKGEQAELERLRALLREWCVAADLGDLRVTPGVQPDLNAHHHAGTTRMGANPRDGVVDADCRTFGLDNVYLAGASVFPAAGVANPTLTIVAMSLRLAHHLRSS